MKLVATILVWLINYSVYTLIGSPLAISFYLDNVYPFPPITRNCSWEPLLLCHRIDTRPEVSLLCFGLGKTSEIFYVLWRHPRVHMALCTYVCTCEKFPCALQDGVIWWRTFTSARKHFGRRLSDTSGLVSILWLCQQQHSWFVVFHACQNRVS
jgi:hypothetical protein